jgi:hypothetical protein
MSDLPAAVAALLGRVPDRALAHAARLPARSITTARRAAGIADPAPSVVDVPPDVALALAALSLSSLPDVDNARKPRTGFQSAHIGSARRSFLRTYAKVRGHTFCGAVADMWRRRSADPNPVAPVVDWVTERGTMQIITLNTGQWLAVRDEVQARCAETGISLSGEIKSLIDWAAAQDDASTILAQCGGLAPARGGADAEAAA